MTIDPTNLAATATLTFDDEFDALSLWNGSSGTWATTYIFADPLGNGSTLAGNNEQEWYINANYGPTAAVDPWTVSNGVLTLTAKPTDPSIASAIGGYDYTSGLINTSRSFSQTYGYFEMSAKLPAGQGIWPAFWLLPKDGSWPPELDVMEVLGKDPTTLYTTSHSNAGGTHTQNGEADRVANMSTGFHTYGVDWQADTITWYFDGRVVHTAATPADMHKPMYMLANLAVGGSWGGPANATTVFPAEMQIDYIRAYADATSAGVTTPAAAFGAAAPAAAASSNDVVMGALGNDTIQGTAGGDTINGRTGEDTVTGGEGADWLYGGKGDDQLIGDGGDDVLLGNLDADTLSGGAGADTLRGGQDDDVITGGDGADWISGDRGADTVSGGAGADGFHFFSGAGDDLVLDFTPQEGDRVQLDQGSVYTLSQSGADTLIDLGHGDHMVLQNFQMSSFSGDWLLTF